MSKYNSIFFIMLLSIARTFSFLFPFTKVLRSHVLIVNCIYLVLAILYNASLFIVIPGTQYEYNPSSLQCGVKVGPLSTKTTKYQVLVWLNNCIIFLPLLIVMITTCFTAYKLKATDTGRRNSTGNIRKQQATVTVILLTVVYIFCNLPSYLISLSHVLATLSKPKFYILIAKNLPRSVINFIYEQAVPINSVFNVIIYFLRIKGLRVHARNIWEDLKKMSGVGNPAESSQSQSSARTIATSVRNPASHNT